jgi:U3 small nucleolar RNA-associated protein 10
MSSELQRQVASIKKTQLEAVSLQQGRPSLFLTASEAAAVDVSAIHEAAYSAITTLQQYDGRFEEFLDSLLHPSTIDLQRELKTKDENKVLDGQIINLLKLLSLYALEPSAHLVLEYLIRRYRVHEMNTHILLQSMLVAHDTKVSSFRS